MADLKPCPFCGGKAEFAKDGKGNPVPWVFCGDCLVETPYCETMEEAIEAWNRRADNG